LGADCVGNGKPLFLAGKKFAVEGIKVKRIFEGYYIRVQGKQLFVPKILGHLVKKKTQNKRFR
jgi:hypothetical protein